MSESAMPHPAPMPCAWRFRSLYGAAHAAQLSGNHDSSQKYFSELLKVCACAEKPPRSELEEAQRAILQK